MTPLHDAIAPTLSSKHPFQLGYATTDLPRAIEHIGRLHNAPSFLVRDPWTIDMRTPRGPIRIEAQYAFAWAGDVQLEIIRPIQDAPGIYLPRLPATGFGVVLHHLGYMVEGELDDWERFRAQIADEDILFEGGVEDHTRYLYLDSTAAIGHPMEYVWWGPTRRGWLDEIPRN